MSKKCELCSKETSFFEGGTKHCGKFLCSNSYEKTIAEKKERAMKRDMQVFECIYCGSANIIKEISVGTFENKTGLKYGNQILPSVEEIYADLCKDCGSVRTYVKETEREWL